MAPASAPGTSDGWLPRLDSGVPAYRALADAIARDLALGRLTPGERLPSQRWLAERLGLNFSTVARGFREAQSRGLIATRVGAGSHALAQGDGAGARARRRDLSDRTMNQAPESQDPALLARVRGIWHEVGDDLAALMRYQSPSGSAEDKAAGLRWLSQRGIEAQDSQLMVTQGTHAAMLAVLRNVAAAGDTVCCEAITYPGIRALCGELGLRLAGLACDAEGPLPEALDARARATRVAALYLNPTVRNPTTGTIGSNRRVELAEVARRHGTTILEDDAYGLLRGDGPPPVAMLAPDITWYLSSLSKCVGAGLRVAYLVAPPGLDARRTAGSLAANTVMVSPLNARLATRLVESGVADEVLAHVRRESRHRQELAASILPRGAYESDPEGFHLWVRARPPWTRARLVDWLRGHALGAVASDAFTMHGDPPEAFRLCLGGVANRQETRQALEFLLDALRNPPNL